MKRTDKSLLSSLTRPLVALSLATAGLWATPSRAAGQDYINSTRPSSSVYLQQSIDGEYGTYNVNSLTTGADGTTTKSNANQKWQGYGLSTSLGYETNKFLQFEIGHTLLNMHDSSDTLAKLSGSRLHLGARMEFDSPIGNLELGAGVLGSIMNYSRLMDSATFYGTGSYYSLGLNYFCTQMISLYAEAKLNREHLLRQTGGAPISSMDTATTEGTFGLRIWL